MPTPDQMIEVLKEVFHVLGHVLILSFFVVGIWVAVHHLKDRLADYLEWFRDEDHRYRVRTTIVKHMMGEKQSIIAKLRLLRVSKLQKELSLDSFPKMTQANINQEPWAHLDAFYSVPGRLGTTEDRQRGEKKFTLILGQDEELKAHKEHSTLMVYAVGEPIDKFLTPPYFTAVQPVGKDCFTYEAHFPHNRKFVRDQNIADAESQEKPKITVYKGVRDKEHELVYEPYKLKGFKGNLLRRLWNKTTNRRRARYHVTGGRDDFGDPRGRHDWFRVTILRPPQNEKIHICWCMEGDTKQWPWCSS